MRRAGRGALAAAAASFAVALLAPGAHAAGLRTIDVRSLEPRLQEVTLATKAVPGGQTRVRVLLPTGYRRHPGRRYPVLYLLHGALEDESAYTDQDFGLREYTRDLPLIVVMPDSGTGGGYVNWWNFGKGGPPRWEDYHVRQLIPWIDARYRTVGTREGRAVAGLSMGGDGALKYAAKHPDLFAAAHSFSGAVDLNVLQQFLEQGPAYGPYATQEVRWRGNNAWDLADNLRGVELALRTGNGQRGGAYGNGIWPGADPVEAGVHLASTSLHERLLRLGIAHVWDDYGPGAHSVPYWKRDLRLSLPLLMRTFRHPPARPRRVSLRAIEPRYSAYGWDVRLQRRALEFSRLSGAGRGGFSLTGSGSAIVRTPGFYAARSRHLVVVGGRRLLLRADRTGRLRIPLRLSRANPFQQYSPEEKANPSRFHRVTVTVKPAG